MSKNQVTQPCPFCGVTALWKLKDDDGENASYFVACAVCKAQGPRAELPEMALPAWNRRPGPTIESMQNLTSNLTSPNLKSGESVVPEAGIEPATKGL
jgi:Lar family restriction alleviation protein